jgi:hypothetical protein
MADEIVPPFSARYGEARTQTDDDFPRTARMGLLHLVNRLNDRGYIGWSASELEVRRIARVPPGEGLLHDLLFKIRWDKALDFCERLYNHLARDVFYEDTVHALKTDVQEYIAAELQLLFLEENLAFEFSNGVVNRRGRRNTQQQVARAQLVLGDPKLSAALEHFNKALNFFRDVSKPDYENSVKDAVCAVEATARVLFPSGGSTLGDVVKSITGSDAGQLPRALAQTFHGLYGFRRTGRRAWRCNRRCGNEGNRGIRIGRSSFSNRSASGS